MPASQNNGTIIAQATAHGEAAISIIRMSGPLSSRLLLEIFNRKKLIPRRVSRGNYRDLDGTIIDDVLFTWFEKPHSYTGEDSAEISCHGNPLIVQKILQDLIRRGCRLAAPGEFTRIAFLNGQMDLTQAEAVADLISARSDHALTVARHQLQGALGNQIEKAVEALLQILAELEAYIDFPEEDLPPEDQAGPIRETTLLKQRLQLLASTSRYGAILREGVRVLIVGAPNAGKSSLLNRLVGHDRVLVSDQPGTTRDAIEEQITIGPYRIRLLDTAGIRASESDLEQLSIEQTMRYVDQADFFLLILDTTLPHPEFPETLKNRLSPENCLVLQNKIDLPAASPRQVSWNHFREIPVSALTGEGIDTMRLRLKEMIDQLNPLESEDFIAVSTRHADALENAISALEKSEDGFRTNLSTELIASHLREALHFLGEITGKVDNESMLDRLFATFCIGK